MAYFRFAYFKLIFHFVQSNSHSPKITLWILYCILISFLHSIQINCSFSPWKRLFISSNQNRWLVKSGNQIVRVPAENADLYDQMATTLQAARLASYHHDMLTQELFNLQEFFERACNSDDEPEKEWFCFVSIEFWISFWDPSFRPFVFASANFFVLLCKTRPVECVRIHYSCDHSYWR